MHGEGGGERAFETRAAEGGGQTQFRQAETVEFQIPFIRRAIGARGHFAASGELAAGNLAADRGESELSFFQGEIRREFARDNQSGQHGFGDARLAARMAFRRQIGICRDAIGVKQRPAVAVLEKNTRAADLHAVDADMHERFRRNGAGDFHRGTLRLRGCRGTHRDRRACGHRNGFLRSAWHAPLAVRVLPPGEDGFLETQVADHEFAAQQRHESEENLELGGLEEIDPGIFHVGHDEPAQADAVPRRVDRAAHAEG